MPPERRIPDSGDHDDMRVRMIHNRSHGPHRARARDACPPPTDDRGPGPTRRGRLTQALRGLRRAPEGPPAP